MIHDMSENAVTVFNKRYVQKDENNNPIEDIEGAYRRVARVVASVEKEPEKYEQKFYNLIASRKFTPNSPTFTGAGTKLGQLAACFVLPISDDMGKESDGIFSTLRNAALIQQTGGGNGFSFSNLRPKNDSVRGSGGVATGPVGFMKVYDAAFGEIAQGGTRRGANMAILRVDHPDIEEFIECKSTEGNITNFNISVGITDKFMQSVKDNTNFDLINPRTGKAIKTINARSLFRKIATYAHHNGEPGVVFLDTANKDNPTPKLFKLEATNPCAEQFLGPYENCCLGSINLAKHVKDGKIDWLSLLETVTLATRFLDDVVDANKYVEAVPQLKDAAQRIRRIGLGIMGLADLFYLLKIRYGSEESLDIASQIMEFVRYFCMRESIELSIEKGAFPEIDNSIYSVQDFQWQVPQSKIEHRLDLERPELNWSLIESYIKKYGIRNAVQTTIAPTGTIGTISDVEGYGCEPVFALGYVRYLQERGRREQLNYVSPIFKNTIEVYYNGNSKEILDEVLFTGSCQKLNIDPLLKNTFVTSQDITSEEHILMQSVLQAWIDNSISKTCNFPKGTTVETVEQAYLKAWGMGCKGLTVYVTGSRDKVVLETREIQLQKTGYFSEAEMCKDGVCSI